MAVLAPLVYRNEISCSGMQNAKTSTAFILIGAGCLGAVARVGSLAYTPQSAALVAETLKDAAIASGIWRRRAPQVGDRWAGCDAARLVGSAPLYVGEPGYSASMDGDGDGIACEDYSGMHHSFRRPSRRHH